MTKDMESLSSMVLFDGFKSGKQDSFRKIYEVVSRPLLNFCKNKLRIADVHDIQLAEDIVANSFYQLFKRRNNIKCIDHLCAFLYTTCKNSIIDHIRGLKYKYQYTKYAKYQSNLEDPSDSDIEYETKERWSKVIKLMPALPTQRKKILELFFIYKKSTREIADIMDLDPQTILNHKTKAIDQLKNMLFNVPQAPASRFSKAIKCIETGIVYPSIRVAAIETGIHKNTLGKIAIDGRSCKGMDNYHFEFVNKK